MEPFIPEFLLNPNTESQGNSFVIFMLNKGFTSQSDVGAITDSTTSVFENNSNFIANEQTISSKKEPLNSCNFKTF
jgi:hypothetical protein